MPRCNVGIVRAVVAVLLVAGMVAPLMGQPPSENTFKEYLSAGEFGPARAMARSHGNAAIRDRWLSDLATMQARVGSRRASISSLSEIGDDRTLDGALDRIGSQMLGHGGRGGAAIADFDTLINLITSTIAPDSWEEVGGAGAIEAFPTGVYVDAAGVLKRVAGNEEGSALADVRQAASRASGNEEARRESPLRKVSLNRLERAVRLAQLMGREPSDVMKNLAGLRKIKYVLIYPESGDIVLAGPAGDWQPSAEGRPLSTETGAPILQLDDLVVVLRNAYDADGLFGCAIKPIEANLAATNKFLEESAKKPLRPGQRDNWLRELRGTVGKQNIEVYGIDPRTRAAHVLVEADYRMKLVGMGLEDGTLGVTSYLDSIPAGAAPPEMSVLRWWFTLNYDAVQSTEARNAFEIHGQGVRVLSENELLTETGRRLHTGKSDELNRKFAASFTRQFELLAAKYPVYADLRNIFDLALVAALMRSEDLPGQVDWHMTHFGDVQGGYQVGLSAAPEQVESVVNHRELSKRQFVAGVSGGVSVDTRSLVKQDAIKPDQYGLMKADHSGSAPKNLPRNAWWWD